LREPTPTVTIAFGPMADSVGAFIYRSPRPVRALVIAEL